jgi:hypothetical protein
MLVDASHRSHAVHVMKDIEPFVKARGRALSLVQKNEFVAELDQVLVALGRFDIAAQAETASIPVGESVERAKGEIWKG